MKIGPNAQAVVDNLAGRPAEIIARESDEVQACFRAMFNGAGTPGTTDGRARLKCGHPDAEAWWPSAWIRLRELGLIAFNLQAIPGKIIMVSQSLASNSMVHWQITPEGWQVHMDDAAWMLEFRAAQQSDEATKQ